MLAANPAGAEAGRRAFGNTALCTHQDCACSFSRDGERKQSTAIKSQASARLGSSALLIGFCSFCWVAGEIWADWTVSWPSLTCPCFLVLPCAALPSQGLAGCACGSVWCEALIKAAPV